MITLPNKSIIGEDVHWSTVEQDPVGGGWHPQLWAAHGLQVGGVQRDQAAGGQQAYVQVDKVKVFRVNKVF